MSKAPDGQALLARRDPLLARALQGPALAKWEGRQGGWEGDIQSLACSHVICVLPAVSLL